eukprot:TRINITY_DN15709_c0_g1_i1.p1 TRINITY_DN15709_c0_g1~~TRINITY_DN15709_c0_g1_i1.p1  ORF type:complete len:106 (-),score=12.49 TRINITY_DN15709_c0_g1_i1:90-407(-)
MSKGLFICLIFVVISGCFSQDDIRLPTNILDCEPPQGIENLSEKDKCRLIPTWTWPGNPQGPCRAFFTKWYYDVSKEACISITYGGCCGTDNLFDSQELCEAKCT